MKKIKKFFKDNYKIFIIYILVIIVMYIPLPYHVYAPGGITNLNKKVNIDNCYKAKGSFNLSYVSEYKGSSIILLFSLIRKDWDIISNKDMILDNETIKDYNTRDQLLLLESYSNATMVAYQKAHKNIKVLSSKVYVDLIFKESKTDLKIGDQIIEVNNTKISDFKDLNEIISAYEVNDQITIKVVNNHKTYYRTAKIINYKNRNIIGIGLVEINKYKTNPKIKFNYDKDESGPSSGLMMALNIYNSITKKDITKGKTIVGTGTISKEGKVGEIAGVKYKLIGSSKKNVDLFIVPKANLKEALKVKKQKHYKFDIIGVNTFDEVINYLKKH